MTENQPERRYALPGGKMDVTSPRIWVRSIVRGAGLFGPSYLRLMRAARSSDRRRLHAAERTWAAAAAAAIDLTVDVHGLDHIDPTERYVVAPLHEGFTDLLALQKLPLEMAYTAAEELFTWQFLGEYLSASSQAAVSRASGASAYRSLLAAGRMACDQGESLVVFPQGTILGIETAFQQGAFRLAEHFGMPVLPVILTGSAGVWDFPFSTTLHIGSTIRLEVLPPIPTDDAVARSTSLEWEMKERALTVTPGPRRFLPERDGWWDGYRYEIDDRFTELHHAVAEHRAVQVLT